jgi:hypothetical protein
MKVQRCHVERFVLIGKPSHRRVPTGGSHGGYQMVEGRPTAQDDLAPKGVCGRHQPTNIGEEMKGRSVDNPSPWLAVVQGRRAAS